MRLVLALTAPLLSASATAQVPAAAPMVVAQVPVAAPATPSVGGGTLRAPGGEGGRLVLVPPRGRPRVLSASFHSAADPEVSFDGKSILFAGRRAAATPGASGR